MSDAPSPWSEQDRANALEQVSARNGALDRRLDEAWSSFWPAWLDEDSPDHEPIALDEFNQAAFTFYRLVDHRCHDGTTALERFLADSRNRPSLRERLYLTVLGNSRRRPYRVGRLDPDGLMQLVDLASGEPRSLCAPELTEFLVADCLLLARILDRTPASPWLEPDWLSLPEEVAFPRVEDVLRVRPPDLREEDAMAQLTPLFQQAWCELLAEGGAEYLAESDDGDGDGNGNGNDGEPRSERASDAGS